MQNRNVVVQTYHPKVRGQSRSNCVQSSRVASGPCLRKQLQQHRIMLLKSAHDVLCQLAVALHLMQESFVHGNGHAAAYANPRQKVPLSPYFYLL